MSDVAIIVGNGASRSEIDLNTLVGQGTIYGCNALYRDFDGWDYLIAIDDRMIDEIKTTSKRMPGQVIFPPEDERWESAEYAPQRRRSNAGMNAMQEAIRAGHNTLYCLGFDFILAGDEALSNVYKDTKNYEPNTQSTGNDNYHRIRYLEWFCNRHKDVRFVFVTPNNVATKTLIADNCLRMNVSTFIEKAK